MTKLAGKRGLALLLCLVMVVSLLPVVSASAADAEPISSGTQVQADGTTLDTENDLRLDKKLFDNGNGSFDLKLDGYATAEIGSENFVEKIPTDFVLVVDQSGSMSTSDMPTGNPTVRDDQNLETVAEGAYYYYDSATDNYYRVYGVKDYLMEYHAANTKWVYNVIQESGAGLSWFQSEQEATFDVENQYYYKYNGVYCPVTVTISGTIGTYYIRFKYYRPGSSVPTYFARDSKPKYKNLLGNQNAVYEDGDFGYGVINDVLQAVYSDSTGYTYSQVKIWPFDNSWPLYLDPINTGMYINYDMYTRHVGYTKLCYRDINGVEHEVPSNNNGQSVWEYCNSDGLAITTNSGSTRPTYSGLYTFPDTTTRINALKIALNRFAQEVADETDSFGAVDNKISIIGFSSTSASEVHNPYYINPGTNPNNTELLTHTERDISSGSTNGWQKSTADSNASEYYGKALVASTNGTTGTVNPKITRAIDAITANGGTQPEDGLDMAYQVLNERGTTEYTIRSGADKGSTVNRNTIVIFFTDGQPGNYSYSDQYAEANDVVETALNIKRYKNTKLFSIGVFGESDGNPLTYDDWTTTTRNKERDDWKYLGGWMETVYRDSYWHCLRREWRPGNAEGYTKTPNDTIFDYMSVTSSNYPDAEEYIAPMWISGTFEGTYIAATDDVRHIETAVRDQQNKLENRYYRMASNQDTLVAAFLQAVTMNNEETSIKSNTALGAEGVLTDVVNTADFDVSSATASAKVVNNDGTEDATLTALLTLDDSQLKTNGTVTVTGFDYSAYYNSKHVVLTIDGIVPNKVGKELKTNVGNAKITDPDDTEDPVKAETTSPVLDLSSESNTVFKILDFNMIANLDSGVTANSLRETTAPGGAFDISGTGDLTFTPDMTTTGKAWDVSAFSGVNQTMYLKSAGWKQAIVIPAASVYVADNLKTLDSDYADGVSGFDSNVTAPTTTAENAKGSRTITFTGTGIDIYATTDDESGWITANLYEEGVVPGSGAHQNDSGTWVNTDLKAIDSVLVKNNSVHDHYGCPTIRFTAPTYGTYTVVINTSVGSNYKFEGVRIYHPADADAQEYYDDPEKAPFTRVRDILLAADTFNNATVNEEQISGAIFVEIRNADNEPTETKTAVAATYQDNGPRGEVYLEPNQAIAFKVNTTDPVLIGMSSADGSEVTYAVTNGTDVSSDAISSTVDMYYEAKPDANGYICIKNDGESGLLAITNVRAASDGATSFSVGSDVLDYIAQFEDLLRNLDPAQQDALKTVWNDNATNVTQLLSALWRVLLQSLEQLFAGLGAW
ncbi:MAG: hypothetical protein IJ112_07245 [Oscillospiraceae bacterium]|nr:hypothetical protein [Oscillospiraceae bacterium]